MTHRKVIEIHGKSSLFLLGLSISEKINENSEAEIECLNIIECKDKFGALLILKRQEEPAKEEPKKRKTYEDDFFEKFPNADFRDKSELYESYCVAELYGVGCQPGSCAECWNREREE